MNSEKMVEKAVKFQRIICSAIIVRIPIDFCPSPVDPPRVSERGPKTYPTSQYDANVVPLGIFSTHKILKKQDILKEVVKM